MAERGYESILGQKRLADLGFARVQRCTPGILMPIWGVDGGIVSYQYRPDSPRLNSNGKPINYETPRGASNRLDCPPGCRELLTDPHVPLYITEGIKKADALASLALCVLGLPGIWNWKAKNEFGGVTISSDFDTVALNERQVYLVPDSDFLTNLSVMQAVRRLGQFLKRKRGNVSVLVIPLDKNGAKVGIDDYIASGHTREEVRALAAPLQGLEDLQEKKPSELYQNFFYHGNRLYLEIVKRDGDYAFANLDRDGKVSITAELTIGDQTIKPRPLPQIEGRSIGIVGMPDESLANVPLLTPEDLYQKIKAHLCTYVDLRELDVDLCLLYILFTWFYPKVDTLGYLRFLADTGKGKSRAQKVVGDLCFYPVFASGASSFAGIARLNNKWHGTLIVDEADINGDKEHQFIKYLNLGFERHKYYVLADKENPRHQDFFDPFSPKIMSMRQPFRDNATEARLLSISPHETTKPDIPILLPLQYSSEMQQLRNELARFALEHFDAVDGAKMLLFNDLKIEPRLKQLAMPLSVIFQVWPQGVSNFKDYLLSRQAEIRRVRSLSWQGGIFNLVYAIALGDVDLTEEFANYYEPSRKQIQCVTPTMVARQMKSSTKAVTQGVISIGFEVELKWISTYHDEREIRKRVRAYTISNVETWKEIIQRYYYSQDNEENPEIPDILKSSQFHPVPESVPSVPPVPQAGVDKKTEHLEHMEQFPARRASQMSFPDDGDRAVSRALGMSKEEALSIWYSEGRPVIHLGPGENCEDLEKLLRWNNGTSGKHFAAVKAWLYGLRKLKTYAKDNNLK
jgi:hypothetical protein